MRPGCDRDAASRLTYDTVACQVWLDDLTDRVGRHQEICVLHAERLTVPRGWELCDRRADQQAMFVPPTAGAMPPATPVARRARPRSAKAGRPPSPTLELFEVLRQELADIDQHGRSAGRESVRAESPSELVPERGASPAPQSEPHEDSGAGLPAEPALDVEPSVDPVEAPGETDVLAVLNATSPLLARAFATTGHQRSVLTQPAPEAPVEE